VRILQHTNTITAIQRRDANIFIGDTAGNITFLYFLQILESTPFEEWTVEEVAELIDIIGSPTAAAAILESRVDGKTLMALPHTPVRGLYSWRAESQSGAMQMVTD
jgi:hypothetical protein